MSEYTKVYLVTSGDGDDGSEWMVDGIYSIRALGEARAAHLNKRDPNCYSVEEWTVDEQED